MTTKIGKQGNSLYLFNQKNINWKYVSRNAYTDSFFVSDFLQGKTKKINNASIIPVNLLNISIEKFLSEDSLEYKQVIYSLNFYLDKVESGKLLKYKQVIPNELICYNLNKEILKEPSFYFFTKDQSSLSISEIIQSKEVFLFYYSIGSLCSIKEIEVSPTPVFKEICRVLDETKEQQVKDISLKKVSFIKTIKPFTDTVFISEEKKEIKTVSTKNPNLLSTSKLKRLNVFIENLDIQFLISQKDNVLKRNIVLLSSSFIQ